jgi:hypothetical protein
MRITAALVDTDCTECAGPFEGALGHAP